jgi:radical SAM superfamily enzyme YgiQ (UPF0313 family)
MKFLLINPTAPFWQVERGKDPSRKTQAFRFSMLSSLYVAASVPSPFETVIVDEEVAPVDFDCDADLVGISFMSFNALRAYEIADAFRKKGKTVIVGGYHPTLVPEEAGLHADAVCLGEAEANIPQMIQDFLSGSLKKYYSGFLPDLRGMPVPDRRLIRQQCYAPVDTVQATRGCPNKCSFCSIASFFSNGFRARPVDEVVDEIAPLRKRILFMDDNIAADREYAKNLFARMIPLGKRWFSQSCVGIAYDDELLRLAVQSGCRGLFIGLESLSDESLRDWRKHQNKARDYEWAIQRLHAAGISVCPGIVFGHNSDTPEIFPKTLDFLLRSNVQVLQATILTPFPGTPLYREMSNQGKITDHDWSHYDFSHVVFQPRGMSAEELLQGHNWVLRNFYGRSAIARRVFRSLRYLTPSTTLQTCLLLNLAYRSRLRTNGTFQKSN